MKTLQIIITVLPLLFIAIVVGKIAVEKITGLKLCLPKKKYIVKDFSEAMDYSRYEVDETYHFAK
jgi:hypothetical protein